MEIQQCKVSPRFPLESRLSQSLNRFYSPEWDCACDPNDYMDVECHPIISIHAPHNEVQYSEVSSFLLYYYNLHATTKKEAKRHVS